MHELAHNRGMGVVVSGPHVRVSTQTSQFMHRLKPSSSLDYQLPLGHGHWSTRNCRSITATRQSLFCCGCLTTVTQWLCATYENHSFNQDQRLMTNELLLSFDNHFNKDHVDDSDAMDNDE